MTKTRFTELQNEIERLEAIDKATSERVAAEFIERESEELPGMFIDHEEWEIENGRGEEIEIPCSLALDMQMANESENIM